MSRKPSMFSKNYRKELKQRKIRRIVLWVSVILIVGGTVIFFGKENALVKNYFVKNGKDSAIDVAQDDDEIEQQDQIEQPSEKEKELEVNNEEKSDVVFEAKLISGKSVLIEVKEENNKKVISNIQCPEAIKGSISPSSEKCLIIDEATQDIYIVDTTQEVKNITNEQYIATTKEVFTKESVLQYTPDYKWVEEAAFIDDTYVAYSSQLPWINEGGDRYLWIVNVNDNTHKGYYNVKGTFFRFGEIKAEGITIEIDGRTIVVNSQGKIVSN